MDSNLSDEKGVSKCRIQESRAFDYFYDPIYTAPSVKGHAIKSRKIILPKFESMFSDLPHYSRTSVRQQEIKEFKDIDLNKNFGQPLEVPKANLLGRDRFKYFVYSTSSSSSSPSPVSPCSFGNQNLSSRTLGTDVSNIPDIIQEELCEDIGIYQNGLNGPKMRDVETQTDFRDSEAQTDPYSPPYVIRPGCDPELLMLTPLTWGNGLPAGKEEIDLIRQVRSQKIQQNIWSRKRQDKTNIGADLKMWTFKALWLKRLREQREQHLNATVKMEKDHHDAILRRRLVERRIRVDRNMQLSDESSDTSAGYSRNDWKE